MEELLEILNDIKDDADFEHCTTLIDDAVLDSFDILSIISALNDIGFDMFTDGYIISRDTKGI